MRRTWSTLLAAAAAIVVALTVAACAHAPQAAPSVVERIAVHQRQPAFGGAAFGDVGPYERIVAEAEVAVDPSHPANRGIVDAAAAASTDGMVRYSTNIVIVRPRDAARASGTWVFEVANRGRKLMLDRVNGGSPQIERAEDAGTGWLMRQGHTLIWVGWQGDVALDASGRTIGMAPPVARGGGSPITGPALEEIIFDAPGSHGVMLLSYPAASLDRTDAELTVRERPDATPTTIRPEHWRYRSASEIEIDRPEGFDAGAIYRLRYIARDPKPMGLGMAAVRDVVTFLKSGAVDTEGHPGLLADLKPRVTIAVGISQSGRLLRDWVWQGFNRSADGTRVFDGMLATIAGSRKTFTNQRWAQPGRYSRQHEDHEYPGDQFPFSYATTTDPVSGVRDGLFARCRADDTCPKTFHLDSSLEYWQARASLVVTDGTGRDIALPDDVRMYLMASTQHVTAATPTAGICVQANNPAQQEPVYRALITRLVEWARDGKAPPPSRYPTVAAGTLVAPTAAAMGFPDLSVLSVTLPTPNALVVMDHSVVPPRADDARRYTLLVPRTDADGNDMAGIRLPDVAVPLATYTGWNRRKPGFAAGQLCGLNGSSVPLQRSAAERAAVRDPRPSIAERYASREAYLLRVRSAAEALREAGLMLTEDVDRWILRVVPDPRIAALP